MSQCVPLALHVSYGWLAYVLFHAYHLDACEQKSLGKHVHLSSWRLRYGLIKWSSLLMLKFLGNLFENLENPLQSSSLICQSPTKAIWWYLLKTLYTYATCLTLSFVILLWPLREFFSCFHDQDSRAHHIPLAMLLWEVSIVPSTHSTK